jgi:hypothetical protein
VSYQAGRHESTCSPVQDRIALFDSATRGINDELGCRAPTHNRDFVDDPAVGLFKAGADRFSRTLFFCQCSRGGKVNGGFLQASQLQLIFVVKFRGWRGRPVSYYLPRPSVDSAFPYAVLVEWATGLARAKTCAAPSDGRQSQRDGVGGQDTPRRTSCSIRRSRRSASGRAPEES